MGAQSLVYFAVAAGSLGLAASLLYSRFVRRDERAINSGDGFGYFAAFMVLFAIGAVVVGLVTMKSGR